MASILFSIKEGIKGLQRARLSTFVSIFSIFLALSALSIFVLFTMKLQGVLDQLQDKVEMESIIDDRLDANEVEKLKAAIEKIEGVRKVEFISRVKAAQRFKESFGMDINELYEEDQNPLPMSFIIRVKKEFLNKEYMDSLQNTVNKYSGITETIFKRELFLLIEKYRNIFLITDLIGGILIALGSIFIVSNTIKLTIYSKSKTIKIMKLIGATDSFIRRPFLIEGLSQGIFGGIGSSLLIYVLSKSAEFFLNVPVSIDIRFYGIIIISGAVLGFAGSYWSARKFLT